MMKKLFMLIAIAASAAMAVFGADPQPDTWRAHRYDSFKGLVVDSASIVFMGNSITNFNEWRECFANDPRIVNRGASSAHSQEMIDNLESVLTGRPAKIFLGIGTNDLYYGYTPEQIAANFGRFIERVQCESPSTEVYVTTILPTNNGAAKGRNDRNIIATNALVKEVCERNGVTQINLFDTLQCIHTDRTISTDDLHLTAKGYKIWADIIAPYVGVECSYPAVFDQNSSGLNYAYGMRSTIWSANEVEADDILFIGDEMICCGSWNELLRNPKAKNRGIWWGYNGFTTKQWERNMEAIFATNPDRKTAPRAVVLNIGMKEVNDTTVELDSVAAGYARAVDAIRAFAPEATTRLIVTTLPPRGDEAFNRSRTRPFNQALARLAAERPDIELADIYAVLSTAEAAADSALVTNDMLTARGYAAVSRLLAPMLGDDSRPLTEGQFTDLYDTIEARSALGTEVDAAMRLRDESSPDYTPAMARWLQQSLEMLRRPDTTNDALRRQAIAPK